MTRLSDHHRAALAASGIAPERAAARGYETIYDPRRLTQVGIANGGQRTPGLLVPLLKADGTPWGYQYRPDHPRERNGVAVKYETPIGQHNHLDVAPGCGDKLRDPKVPLWVTEGSKKADAAALHGLCCVSIIGVWGWHGKATTTTGYTKTAPKGAPLVDWDQIPLDGRRVILAFDSDMASKPEVRSSCTALAKFLTDRGAKVEILHLPDTDADEKVGLDDYLAQHTVEDLWELVEPAEVNDADDDIQAFKLPDGQRPTDVGNANRLLIQAGGRIRYVHAWGKWIVYRDGRWIVDEKDALVTEQAKQVSKSLYKLAAKIAATNPEEAKPIWSWALKSDTSAHIAAMIRLARGVPGILVNHEDLDADPWLLNCANGTVDLRTGHLQDHNPADLCTLQVPVDYDPHATAPLWETCLKRWQPDADVRDYLQLRAGAGATGIPTETVDIDYGNGGNGKSKFHGAIQYVLGPYTTVPHKSLLVSGRFEQHPTVVAALFRKRLAVASETKAAETLNDEQVKNLTGGDRLEGRRMREDPWGFWPSHTLVLFSNHKPTVQGRDEGIWRRLRLVPWLVTITEDERDEGLAFKLQAEAPGILRWIVEGAVRFHQAGGLRPPEVVRAATDEYRVEEDVVGRFIAEVLEFTPHTFCYSSDIKHELDAWCDENDIDTPPRMNDITANLLDRGASNGGRRMIHGKRSTIWHGVCITQKGGGSP